jgi:hypothetical protein
MRGQGRIIDEATEKVVGQIPLETGIPRTLQLSHDRTRFHVLDSTFQQIEIVDIASRKTLKSSTSATGTSARGSAAFRPTHQPLVALTRAATKLVDRLKSGHQPSSSRPSRPAR